MKLSVRDDALEKKLADNPIDKSVLILVQDAKRRGRQIFFLGVLAFLTLVLLVGFAILSVQTYHTVRAVQKNTDVAAASCKSGNEFRQAEANLWNHILSLPPNNGGLTAEQEAQRQQTVRDFKKYLDTNFAPRDCSTIINK